MSGDISFEVKGLKEVLDLLDKMEPKATNRVMAKATAEGAKKVLKPKLKSAAAGISRRLSSSVRAGSAKRDKPAGIVRFDPKRAWFRHFIIGGTKPHRIRFHDQVVAGVPKTGGNIQHPGAKPHPIVTEVADQYGDDALDVTEKYLVRSIGLD